LDALVIWPKIVTAKMATTIQKSGPRKIFCERVCGAFFAPSFFSAGLTDFLIFCIGVWEVM
jgi:hypothetical protein